MGDYKTREDYANAAVHFINTGAEMGLVIKTPEARMIEELKKNNVIQATNLYMGENINYGINEINGNLENINYGINQNNQNFENINNSLNEGFNNLVSGLSSIDQNLVQGFGNTINAIEEQTDKLVEIGKLTIKNTNLQHELDRENIAKIGESIVTTIRQENLANRETMIAATKATIETLQTEGNLSRELAQRLTEAVIKNINSFQDEVIKTLTTIGKTLFLKLNEVSDKLSSQAELITREHTKAALLFFKSNLLEEAKESLKKALNNYLGYFPAIYLTALISFIEGDYAKSEKYLNMSFSQINTENKDKQIKQQSMSLLLLGRIQVIKKNWEDADKIFGKLGDINHKFIVAHIEQAFAIFNNNNRGSLNSRITLIYKGLDSLKLNSSLAWYGFSLLLAENNPEEATSALKRAVEIDTNYKGTLTSNQIYKILKSFYPSKIKYLFLAILRYKPELKWIMTK